MRHGSDTRNRASVEVRTAAMGAAGFLRGRVSLELGHRLSRYLSPQIYKSIFSGQKDAWCIPSAQ